MPISRSGSERLRFNLKDPVSFPFELIQTCKKSLLSKCTCRSVKQTSVRQSIDRLHLKIRNLGPEILT